MKYVHLNILIMLTSETELKELQMYKLLRGISWLIFELQDMLHRKSSKSGSENYARF